ncbi:VOC family protein [Ottowia testudinis]|uniref:VOC family protein n=1 Tax=Ottowia testudinis TaxID=2816950 RepID=A0A975CHV9_9BURK|nr:VOC family protein [Ottowia testudinis]QTD43678.1 VOC family protein [Ottowia testudinis]
MQLGYTILYVDDVGAALAFYERAFGFATRFAHESGDWGELDTGATTLAFCSRALLRQQGKTPAAPNPDSPSAEIALVADDVPGALARALQAGASLKQPVEHMPWGQTVAYVADPEGFWVELCTPVSLAA